MGRIRTIKPEFFMHEGLYDAEAETGLPLRLAFAGIWTACDREGRFEWRPRALKAAILPYDDVEFSRVLDALTTRGFIIRYASEGREFGAVPSFSKHQVINNREKCSEIPPPPQLNGNKAELTRHSRVDHASPTPLKHALVEGKGKEGEEEREEEGKKEESSSSARKREADGIAEDDDAAPVPPDLDPGFLADLRQAVGVSASAPPAYWTGPGFEAHVAAWLELGLTEDQVVETARASQQNHDSPPDGPKALDRAMQRAAAALRSAGAVKPMAGKPMPPPKAPLDPQKRLEWYAEAINGEGYVAPSMVNNSIAAALLHAGLVTREKLRERGIAA